MVNYNPNELPVFVGHYWLSGIPAPVRDNVGCLDYSAVNKGMLVAYRIDQEKRLRKDKFVWERVTAGAHP